MPDRYHIHTVATPGRFHRVGQYGSVDWREDCSRCSNCVKPRCQYDAYQKEVAHNRDPLLPVQPLYECKACLACVQACTKGLLALSINPEYLDMGDKYWTPDLIAATWTQADAGRIPVSGAGYRGRFHGPGFDSIWTDMSEIVRPTRDGIHGREYISTSVDIGPKPLRLKFSPDGRMETPVSALIEIQMPAILDVPPWPIAGKDMAMGRVAAAAALKTLAVARPVNVMEARAEQRPWIVPLLAKGDVTRAEDFLGQVRLVEIPDGPDLGALAEGALNVNPRLMVAVRMDLGAGAADRVAALAKGGIKVIHLVADLHGRQRGVERPRHLKDALREIHGRLIGEGVRDEVTLIAGGGIALAEHMAKAILCGADLVAADTALLVALGCRVCRGAHESGGPAGGGSASGESCPAAIDNADASYSAQRMINLMGAWHSQLIEVLGAMGIREVRRLRGEVGRAIFREDMEREAFGDLLRK
jgi:ferredoxin